MVLPPGGSAQERPRRKRGIDGSHKWRDRRRPAHAGGADDGNADNKQIPRPVGVATAGGEINEPSRENRHGWPWFCLLLLVAE